MTKRKKKKWCNNNDEEAWCKSKNDDVNTKAKNVTSSNPFYDPKKKACNNKVTTKQKKSNKAKETTERKGDNRKETKTSVLYVGEGSILGPFLLYIKTSGFL